MSCSICFEQLASNSEERTVALRCCHNFHRGCIARHPRCPICAVPRMTHCSLCRLSIPLNGNFDTLHETHNFHAHCLQLHVEAGLSRQYFELICPAVGCRQAYRDREILWFDRSWVLKIQEPDLERVIKTSSLWDNQPNLRPQGDRLNYCFRNFNRIKFGVDWPGDRNDAIPCFELPASIHTIANWFAPVGLRQQHIN